MEVCFDMYRNQYNTAQIDLGFLCCYLCLFFFFLIKCKRKLEISCWNNIFRIKQNAKNIWKQTA